MNRPARLRLRVSGLGCGILLALVPLWPALARADAARWKTGAKELAAYFPAPTAESGSPHLLVVPLLGPARELLPGGKLIVWVGRNDGTPLAEATVTVRVPAADNPLVSGGNRVEMLTLQTDAAGLATVMLTAPDVPKPKKTPGGGDGGGGGESPE